MSQIITGPREGDLVRWRAEIDNGMDMVRTSYDGRSYPVQVSQSEIELTLYGLTKDETLRAIDTINVMRGGASASQTYAGGVSGPPPKMTDEERVLRELEAKWRREKKPQPLPSIASPPKEEPRPLSRFEGLDL